MSSSSMRGLFSMFGLFALLLSAYAKPSHPLALHHLSDHVDTLPPLFPAEHFHAIAPPAPAPAPLPYPQPLPLPLAASAPVFAPPPVPVFEPAPAPVFHTHAALPATFFQAPAPLPAPVFPAPVPALPLANVLPPVLEAVPFALHAPTYRAIPGPKTTTHHISVGFAFPAPPVAKFVAAPLAPVLHSNLAAPSPLALAHHHHHHHSLF